MSIVNSIKNIFSSKKKQSDPTIFGIYSTISQAEKDARKRFNELGFLPSGNYLQTIVIDGFNLTVNMMMEGAYHIYLNDKLVSETGDMKAVESMILSLNKRNIIESRNNAIDKILS